MGPKKQTFFASDRFKDKKREAFITVWNGDSGRYEGKVVDCALFRKLLLTRPPVIKRQREKWLQKKAERRGVG